MTRHIGGSLLPSNDDTILLPIETTFGVLQVRIVAELDEHALFLKHDRGECLIAMHGNGFSCHHLAKRMSQRHEKRIRDQVGYILDCGGTARNVEHIVGYALGTY